MGAAQERGGRGTGSAGQHRVKQQNTCCPNMSLWLWCLSVDERTEINQLLLYVHVCLRTLVWKERIKTDGGGMERETVALFVCKVNQRLLSYLRWSTGRTVAACVGKTTEWKTRGKRVSWHHTTKNCDYRLDYRTLKTVAGTIWLVLMVDHVHVL